MKKFLIPLLVCIFVFLSFSKSFAWEDVADLNKQIAQWDQKIATNPDEVSNYYPRGLAYYKKGEYAKAIPDFSRHIDAHP